MTPSIAAGRAGKARLFEHTDVRVRAGARPARSAGKSSQPDVGSTVMPAPMALVTFPERKVTRAAGRRGKDMDVEYVGALHGALGRECICRAHARSCKTDSGSRLRRV